VNGCPWDPRACAKWAAEVAAERGVTGMLEWCTANGCPWYEGACSLAAEFGQLGVLKWARENGAPWGTNTCPEAAGRGDLILLRWCREQGCPWDQSTCLRAVEGACLDVLKWARAHNCPWDPVACSWAASYAASVSGNLELLTWCLSNGCPRVDRHPDNPATTAIGEAVNACQWWSADGAGLTVIEWMKADGYLWQPDESWCAIAGMSGDVLLLQWLRGNSVPWDYKTVLNAAESGHMDVLRWCNSNGHERVDITGYVAADRDDIGMLTWCRDVGIVFNEHTHARPRDIGVMVWLRDNHCPFDALTPVYAGRYSVLDVLEWSTKNGCPFDVRVWLECEDTRTKEYNPIWLWCENNGFVTGECVERRRRRRVGLKYWGLVVGMLGR